MATKVELEQVNDELVALLLRLRAQIDDALDDLEASDSEDDVGEEGLDTEDEVEE